jgi:hypothetical protein
MAVDGVHVAAAWTAAQFVTATMTNRASSAGTMTAAAATAAVASFADDRRADAVSDHRYGSTDAQSATPAERLSQGPQHRGRLVYNVRSSTRSHVWGY